MSDARDKGLILPVLLYNRVTPYSNIHLCYSIQTSITVGMYHEQSSVGDVISDQVMSLIE